MLPNAPHQQWNTASILPEISAISKLRPPRTSELKQVFDNGQRFYLESLQLFGSKLVDPYRWVNKDYVDILGQIRAKDNGAAKIAEGFLRSRQISPTTV